MHTSIFTLLFFTQLTSTSSKFSHNADTAHLHIEKFHWFSSQVWEATSRNQHPSSHIVFTASLLHGVCGLTISHGSPTTVQSSQPPFSTMDATPKIPLHGGQNPSPRQQQPLLHALTTSLFSTCRLATTSLLLYTTSSHSFPRHCKLLHGRIFNFLLQMQAHMIFNFTILLHRPSTVMTMLHQ